MLQLKRTKESKWIFQKNIRSKSLMETYLKVLDELHEVSDKNTIQKKCEEYDGYIGRSDNGCASTMGVRFSQMCFYMFGYKTPNNTFIPTQMTTNILKDKNNLSENMLVNLFSIQFPHPYSKTPDGFTIYVGRLLLKLLTDERIGRRLYIDEYIWFLPFIKKIDYNIYEELVLSIIEYRKLNYTEKMALFHSVYDYDGVFANCLHEGKYYFMNIFADFGVLKFVVDEKHNDGNIFSFKHGNSNTFRTDALLKTRHSGYITIVDNLVKKTEKLLSKYSAFDVPHSMADDDCYSKESWITDLYCVNPINYLSVIMPEMCVKSDINNCIQDMVNKSKHSSNDGKEFENSLKPVFELFKENIKTEVIGGSGNTDVLCAMEKQDASQKLYKVNIEAKKGTSSEKMQVKRLERHIKKHGADYCIVVAPRFGRATILDIADTNIVTLTADCLAKYCLKECFTNRYVADFTAIDKIIRDHLGEDITKYVNQLIEKRYGM